MNKPMILLIRCLLIIVLLSSCASETTMVRYYTLASLPQTTMEGILENKNKLMILIEPLALADYLRQPGLVVQKTDHQLQISNIHRWAESLEKSATRVIHSQLESKLPAYRFEGQSGRWKAKPKYRVSIELAQFQIVNYRKKTVTSGQFWIFDENRELLVKRNFLIEEKLTENGYEHAISRLELSLINLAGLIVNKIESGS